MAPLSSIFTFGLLASLATQGAAQCSTTLPGTAPAVAAGYKADRVSTDVTKPRGIIFDSQGHLLVVQLYVGVVALTLDNQPGTCVRQSDKKVVITDSSLNHGIQLSADGLTLYVSNSDKVFAYIYDPVTASVTGNPTTVVYNMSNTDHVSRTLLLSNKSPGTMLINRGSSDNIDIAARTFSSGHARIKAFDLNNAAAIPYDYVNDGRLIGWGLRNNVGIAEEPVTGGLWSVENSLDNFVRKGVDIHENNPGEKLNYFGTLINNKSPNQGSNFGYPDCFAAWSTAVPANKGITVGSQFSRDTRVISDAACRTQRTAPRLVFPPHSAPLDIKFKGSTAFVTQHGSFNRKTPTGYAILAIPFNAGQPVSPLVRSMTAYKQVFGNSNLGSCYPSHTCIRPVGMIFDSQNRMFFSSDNTNEIWVMTTP